MVKPSLKTLYQPLEENKLADNVYSTGIEGLLYLPYNNYPDNRGFFSEISRFREFEPFIKEPFNVKQLNHAMSKTNVVRGFHAEDWNKLITVATGVCFCALADARPNSSTFGKVETFLLGRGSDTLPGGLYIPRGIANSVCVLEGPVNYLYCVDKIYQDRDPAGDIAISLFDPDIDVDWPVPREEMIYSERDTNSQTLREKFPEKFQ